MIIFLITQICPKDPSHFTRIQTFIYKVFNSFVLHRLPQYADLDEFLSENGIPVDGLANSHLGGHSTSVGNGTTNRNDSLGTGLSLGIPIPKRERSPTPDTCLSPDTMGPASPADSSEII